jgi:hypothetical protein
MVEGLQSGKTTGYFSDTAFSSFHTGFRKRRIPALPFAAQTESTGREPGGLRRRWLVRHPAGLRLAAF